MVFYEGTDPDVAPKNFTKVCVFKRVCLFQAGGTLASDKCTIIINEWRAPPLVHEQALTHFAQAASQGHVPGIYNTAVMLLQGPPEPVREATSNHAAEPPFRGRDFKKALNYFTAAATQGHVREASQQLIVPAWQ